MSKKRYAAIICEYNPFHYGHLHQIEVLKKEYDGILCIMSGNLVQRGEIAIADKYKRAEAALLCGANLVVELPFPYCMLSARDFAFAGVTIAAMLGADALAFGCEDDFCLLTHVSEITSDSNFEKKLQTLIKTEKNLSYPKAKELLVEQLISPEASEAIRKPNNILTLEYLAAIKNGRYEIHPHPVTREQTLRSSSSIRKEQNREAFLSALPPESASVYNQLNWDEFPRTAENLSQYILASLRRYHPSGAVYGTPIDLQKLIMSTAHTVTSFSELVNACQNTLYTEARVRRSVLSMVFGITPVDALCKPSYTLLLAADSIGCAYLKSRKKQIQIPVITKPSHIKRQSQAVQDSFYREAGVDNVLSLSAPKPEASNNLRKTPHILCRN